MGFKIVRDRVGDWARKNGVSGVWRTCSDPVPALGKKVLEEIGEYVEHGDPAELYDLRDVLDRLISLVDPFGAGAMDHEIKVAKFGSFDNLIEWSPVPPENEWQVDRNSAPAHDWNMPHDTMVTIAGDPNGCPPRCPYRLWHIENEEAR